MKVYNAKLKRHLDQPVKIEDIDHSVLLQDYIVLLHFSLIYLHLMLRES